MQAPSARSRPACAVRRSPAQTTSRLRASLPVHQLVRVQTLEMSTLRAPLGRVPCHPRLRPLLDPPTRLWQTRVSISAWVHRRSHLSPMHDTCPSVTQTLTPPHACTWHLRCPSPLLSAFLCHGPPAVDVSRGCIRSGLQASFACHLSSRFPRRTLQVGVRVQHTFVAGRITLRGPCPLLSCTCSASKHFAISSSERPQPSVRRIWAEWARETRKSDSL